MENKKFSYKEAMMQLNEIVYKIEHDEPDVDELSSLVKTATGLITACKRQLRETEEDLNQALNQIEENEK